MDDCGFILTYLAKYQNDFSNFEINFRIVYAPLAAHHFQCLMGERTSYLCYSDVKFLGNFTLGSP